MKFLSGKAIVYMALIFLSGAVLGVVGQRSYTAYNTVNVSRQKGKGRLTPEEYRRGYINFMQKRLELTPDQVMQLGLIFDETRAKFDELQERMIPEQTAIANGQTEKIRAMLDEKQRAEFEVLRKEREERNRRKNKDRKGRPGF